MVLLSVYMQFLRYVLATIINQTFSQSSQISPASCSY